MLHRVYEYGVSLGEAEPGFKPQQIRWAIMFDSAGQYLGVKELGDASERRNAGLSITKCPTIEQTGDVIWSQCLWSDLRKMWGWSKDGADQTKADRCRAFFLDRLREAAAFDEPLTRLAENMAREETRQTVIADLKRRKAKPSDTATIEIDGRLPVQSEAFAEWWRSERKRITALIGSGPKPAASARMRCLLSGELETPARVHPFIQGMSDVGGNAKSALVSFNEAAFCSFGQTQSANAAISEQAASAYTGGFNDLIKKRAQRLISSRYVQQVRKGKRVPSDDGPPVWAAEQGKPGQDAKVILWFNRPEINAEFNCDILLDPSPFEGAEQREALRAEQRGLELLSAIRRGERPQWLGASYYCAVISAAMARVMVRAWSEGPLTEFADAVLAWFDDLQIADAVSGELRRPPPFARLVGALARKKSDVAPAQVLALWLAAIERRAIPDAVAAQALTRLKVEISAGERPRADGAALLKAWLLRRTDRKVKGKAMQPVVEPGLRENHPDPAYQCVRLMAVLAALQRKALGDVGAGVIQRYYSAASATPGLVLGRLLRSAQHHLEKLEPGLRFTFNGKIAAITARIGDRYPPPLGLEGQSMFALGYYQQIAEDRRQQQIHQAKKEAQANA